MQITEFGKQYLQEKLVALKEELRLTYIKRQEAAAEGDLKENSAYIYAGEHANVLNTQIEEIVSALKNIVVQDPPNHTDFVCFGHQIKVFFESDNRELTITLVGKYDAQLKPGWISIESPIGAAIVGKKVADKVVVNDQSVRIISIETSN